MPHVDADSLQAFLNHHAKALAWIVRDGNGAYERSDLESELFLILLEQQASGEAFTLDSGHDAACLLRELRRRFRPDRAMRNAARPDHAAQGEDWRPGMVGWEQLAADGGAHPLSLLDAIESPEPEAPDFDAYHSETAAWHQLALRFERRMVDIAAFLLISTSWGYARRRRARRAATRQWPLPNPLDTGTDDGALRPWRKFKLPTRQRPTPATQTCFDFWHRPSQPDYGQLWLL